MQLCTAVFNNIYREIDIISYKLNKYNKLSSKLKCTEDLANFLPVVQIIHQLLL